MYNITKTTIKPANAEWFSVANPEIFVKIRDWEASQPGFRHILTYEKTDTHLIQDFEFETENDYQAFLAALATNEYEQVRLAYNAANNIVHI